MYIQLVLPTRWFLLHFYQVSSLIGIFFSFASEPTNKKNRTPIEFGDDDLKSAAAAAAAKK